MDNAQKAIMIGVGLFITIIIIAAVMLITGAGQDLMNEGMNQLSGISANLQAQLTQDYDGKSMRGSDVIAAVKSKYKTDGLIVAVHNGKSLVQYGTYSYTGETAQTEIASTSYQENTSVAKIGYLSNKSQPNYYINPTESYEANLIRFNDSDAVVGIIFEKK